MTHNELAEAMRGDPQNLTQRQARLLLALICGWISDAMQNRIEPRDMVSDFETHPNYLMRRCDFAGRFVMGWSQEEFSKTVTIVRSGDIAGGAREPFTVMPSPKARLRFHAAALARIQPEIEEQGQV